MMRRFMRNIFFWTELEDLRDLLGESARGLKLFTIGENNMSLADMSSEMRKLRGIITRASQRENPEFRKHDGGRSGFARW